MSLLIVLLIIFVILWYKLEIHIDITPGQIILWYTPLGGTKRTFKILYSKSDE